MSSTRSSARLAAKVARDLSKKVDEVTTTKVLPTRKRAIDEESNGAGATKKARAKAAATSSHPPTGPVPEIPTDTDVDTLVPAVLTFSFKAAKEHLIGVDRRFEAIFNKLSCKPYENLEQFEKPEILTLIHEHRGQQISWLAARSITHKFKRLYDPTLPEKSGEIPSVRYQCLLTHLN
jgi:DNA-3-methyladenine glycosylase II